MHYEIDYTKLDLTEEQKERKAVKDCLEYLGAKRFKLLLKAKGPKQLDFWCHMLCGIQGYPVFALVKRYFPDQYDEWYNSLPD